MFRAIVCLLVCLASAGVPVASAQAPAGAQSPSAHDHLQVSGWQFMRDGALFGVFNRQGGPRGGREFKVPNWWMGMLTRRVGESQLTFNTMLSLDPATAGKSGYAEIFQVGEAVDGRPLIDRQHPHDFIMQLAAIWRLPIAGTTGLTIAGGPAGEPALGPVAFMHRASAAEYPFATLSHHIFDSTHIAYGVVTAAFDRGPWVVEASLFNGREPDERRWDFDFGPLDSASARVWYRPTAQWEFQASTGHLVDPEELEPGNVQRTTASASWLRRKDSDFAAITIGYGANVAHEVTRHALFAEGTRRVGSNSMFLRMEAVHVETDLLLTGSAPGHDEAERRDPVGAVTVGGVRDVLRWRGIEGGFGAAATFYAVPESLKVSHGAHPVSFQLFFRLRPTATGAGRMWNMRMAQPMLGHTMDDRMSR